MISVADSETKKKAKYYIDSATHRLKERAWQVALFLLAESDYGRSLAVDEAELLFDKIIKSTINDEQASVSALQQLCLVQLLTTHSQFYAKILTVIDSFGDEVNTGKSVSVSGMLIVAYLFASGANSSKLLLELIPVVLRLQQSNNYIVRIYAIGLSQAILCWFEQNNALEALKEKYDFFSDHVAFWRRVSNGNVGKNVSRVLANPFISGQFQAPRDITLRAIFRTLLKLNGSCGSLGLESFVENEFKMKNFGDFDEKGEVQKEEAPKVLNVEMHQTNDAQQQKIAPWMEEKV